MPGPVTKIKHASPPVGRPSNLPPGLAGFRGETLGMNIFFQKLKLPKVNDVDRNLQDAEITSEEVGRAIIDLKNGKACSQMAFHLKYTKLLNTFLYLY